MSARDVLEREPGSQADDRLTGRQVADLMARAFGLNDVDQEHLGGELDQNVKISARDGRCFLLKISSSDVDLDSLRWQNALLANLGANAPGVRIPEIVPGLDGQEIVALADLGAGRSARLFVWIDGCALGEVEYHPPALLQELGSMAGTIVGALATFRAPARQTRHEWDLSRAREVIADGIDAVEDPGLRADVGTIMGWYDDVADLLDELPVQVVHHDLNDANVLVDFDKGAPRICGVIDAGDALHTIRVAEIAVCAGYAMLRKADPLLAAATVISAFDALVPLTDEELTVVFPLAAARLCMNATTWIRRTRDSGAPYGKERMRDTAPALRQIAQLVPEVAEAAIRAACGRSRRSSARSWVASSGLGVATSIAQGRSVVEVDLSPESDLFDELGWSDAEALRQRISLFLGDRDRTVGVIAHLAPSLLRSARRAVGTDEPATVQLGLGLLMPPGGVVILPSDGVVEQLPSGNRPAVLRHGEQGAPYWTSWWGVAGVPAIGSAVHAGSVLGTVAASDRENGLDGLVQVVGTESRTLAERGLPRFVAPSEQTAWGMLTFAPLALLGLPPASPVHRRTVDEVFAARHRHIGRSQRTYYRRPMNLVRGRGVWLYDEASFAYLDSLNNVTHVGHADERVTAAARRQMMKLNTNSRFVYDGIGRYAERIAATLPPPLDVVFLVCTGSEANDLALRIARQVTGRQDVVVIDGAYHGNTGAVTGISPNRYKGPGGAGAPATTHEVPIPDRYRGRFGYDDPDAGSKYAAEARAVINGLAAAGKPPAAFVAESLMGTAGNIVLPSGYLSGVFAAARSVGALRISDEVQVGVGRMGDAFWGFELAGVVPDIVTMGKPLGNGHPLAALVTTREIADAFDTGMKYFNTFGGNPVSCAIGEAVLDIVEHDELQARARAVGAYFHEQLNELRARQPMIGDVRAHGLYLGVELVRDSAAKEPAALEAMLVTELMKDRGVLVFPNGVHDNVLKIKPPMIFGREHVDLYVETLDVVLSLPELSRRQSKGLLHD